MTVKTIEIIPIILIFLSADFTYFRPQPKPRGVRKKSYSSGKKTNQAGFYTDKLDKVGNLSVIL
jgi:hypothetical protein